MDIKVKKLDSLAKLPTKGSEYSAGYDLYAATDVDIVIPPHCTVPIDTGLSFELPSGLFAAIFARSGMATHQGLRPANCVGVCDSDYRGRYIVALHNDTEDNHTVPAGARIAQVVFLQYYNFDMVEVDELSETERGTGGFGSTGIK